MIFQIPMRASIRAGGCRYRRRADLGEFDLLRHAATRGRGGAVHLVGLGATMRNATPRILWRSAPYFDCTALATQAHSWCDEPTSARRLGASADPQPDARAESELRLTYRSSATTWPWCVTCRTIAVMYLAGRRAGSREQLPPRRAIPIRGCCSDDPDLKRSTQPRAVGGRRPNPIERHRVRHRAACAEERCRIEAPAR